MLRTGAHPIKNIFQAVAIQPHAVILHPELRLVIPAAGHQGDVLYSTPVQGGVFQQIQQYLLHQGGIHRDQQQFIWGSHLHGKIGVPPAELGRRARHHLLHRLRLGDEPGFAITVQPGDRQEVFHHVDEPLRFLLGASQQLPLLLGWQGILLLQHGIDGP